MTQQNWLASARLARWVSSAGFRSNAPRSCRATEAAPEELSAAPAQGAVGWCRVVLARRSSVAVGAGRLGHHARGAIARVGGGGKRDRTMMRHSGAPLSVPGLPDGMQASAPLAGLIALSRAPDAAATGAHGTARAAVAPTPIAASASGEQSGTRTERADRLPVTLGLRGPDRTGAHGSNDPAPWDWMEDGQARRSRTSAGVPR